MKAYKDKKYIRRKIKDIPPFDRPREKIVSKGAESLSNLELLSVIVGNGIKGKDVFAVAKEIYKLIEENFDALTIEKLQNIDGVGTAKACQIMAAIEVSRRFLVREGTRILDETDVLPLVEDLKDKKQEYFLTITLDGGHRILQKRTVFIGTLNQSLIHPREIFADAITDRAAAIIFVHNHPGHETYPSKEDILATKRLQDVAELMGIEVLDHIIVTKNGFFSFKKKGLLDSK